MVVLFFIIPIILCIIGFKSDKLIATMIMIPNLMGIGYRLFIFFNDFCILNKTALSIKDSTVK